MKKLLLGLAASLVAATPAIARDVIVTTAKPGHLYVFDAKSRALEQDCLLGVNNMPGVIAMSPDGKTAYMLVERWEDVIGINIETCKRVFYAKQSEEGIRRKTIASLAVSKDGSELYTVRNPTKISSDRYEVMEPELAVFDTSAGLEAAPKVIHPAPRRATIMATDRNGKVYIGGHDVYAVAPSTGAIETAIANASWDRPKYSPPDVLAFWPIGTQNDEFLLLYSAAVFADEAMTELADFVWGYESVDLTTGETELADFASFEVIMFSAVRNPVAENELFGVYTQLSKHDLETKELIKRVDLPHTYYCINISSDGSEIYVGGTNDDIGIYSSDTLERIGEMRIPSGGDMAVGTLHVVQLVD